MKLRPGVIGTAILLAAALSAPAASSSGELLRAPSPVDRVCHSELLPASSPGVAGVEWSAPGQGFLSATLAGGRAGDWDLALFRGRQAVAASSSFTSRETATAWVRPGERIAIQACRIAGSRAAAPLSIHFDPVATPRADDDLISLESVAVSGAADVARLERLGFDVTHDVGPAAATVVLYSDAQRERLARAGFASTTVVKDMVAADAAARAAEDEAVRALPPIAQLPSGRTTYRQYADYTSEMKELADANPGLVRSVLVGETLEGRPIEGIEIAAGVNRSDDGRPVFLNLGLHHAREWPSGELPMEFAIELVDLWNAGDAEVRALLDRVRVITVPVVNVDGFLASRSWGTSAVDDDELATLPLIVNDQAAYKRKNCRPTVPGQASLPCAMRTNSGVDLNRNYGAYWGGPGASMDPTSQSYRGAGPYSEPESEAIHEFTSRLHPTVLISNHTFTEGRWLRQPGFDAEFLEQVEVPTYDDSCPANDDGDLGAVTPDEAGMKSLGDDMAAANGWISELGYETLCDITGATEDWNYFSQGTYGYTPEIRGPNFHGSYAQMVVAEYVGGDNAPPEVNPLGMREAYLIAADRAADRAEHSVIRGSAPPGTTLRLRKEFATPTCEDAACAQGNGPAVDDVLEMTIEVPADGTYEWDVNPSGRPLFPAETYTMICEQSGDGGELVSRDVSVARGAQVTQDFERCGPPLERFGTCAGQAATIAGTNKADRPLRGTPDADVILALKGDDRVRGRGGADVICAKGGDDRVSGGPGRDKLRAGGGADRVHGGPGRDRCQGGRGKDRLKSC